MIRETRDLTARLRAVVAVLGRQVKAAEQIGISQAALSNYVRGAKNPPQDVLERLAEKANVRLEWLMEGHGPFFEGEQAPPPDLDGATLSPGALVDLLDQHLKAHPDSAGLLVAGLRRAGVKVPNDAERHAVADDPQAHQDGQRPRGLLRHPHGGTVVPADDYENLVPALKDQYVPLLGPVAAGLAFQWNEEDFPPKTADRYVRVRGEAPGGFAMQVMGHSMEPELSDGAIVLFGGRIQLADTEPHGRPALAIYEDDGGKLRYAVRMTSAAKKTVRMNPLNARSYRDLQIPRHRLHALYAIIGPVMP
jgi:transcriptional regulator with XRE-family HTH domain